MIGFIPQASAASTTLTSAAGNYVNVPIGLQQYVTNLYDFAFVFAGVLAFGMIVYSAVRYTLAAANPSQKADAKEGIINALLGLLLLMGAYVILSTINPEIANLQMPPIKAIVPGDLGQFGSSTLSCANCVALAPYQCKDGCTARPEVLSKLQAAAGSFTKPFVITEAYPPTARHADKRHYNGCAIDVSINGGDCFDVQSFIDAAQQAGFTALNEYPTCPGGVQTDFATGNGHVHLDGC